MLPLVAALLVLLPSLANACPACLGQQDSFNLTLKILGVFILFPFLVVALVLRAIRAESKRDDE
jgi:hypothetical protein